MKPHISHFFTDDFESVILVRKVLFHLLDVLGSCFADDGLQGLDDILFLNFFVCYDNGAKLLTTSGFNNCAIALIKEDVFWVKVVHFVAVFKLYTNNYCHLYFASNIEKRRESTTA